MVVRMFTNIQKLFSFFPFFVHLNGIIIMVALQINSHLGKKRNWDFFPHKTLKNIYI